MHRYGRKLDAVALMQEWLADIGQPAGLTQRNARLLSGAVGVPESRLEVCTRALVPLEQCSIYLHIDLDIVYSPFCSTAAGGRLCERG